MSRRVWVEGVMQWRRQKATGSWIEDNPPLPKWARESGGFVSADRFIRLWTGTASLSALKRELFWMSLEDIESQAMLLSDWLEDAGYQPLPPKLMWEQAPLSEDELAGLVADGLVVEAVEAEDGELAAAPAPVPAEEGDLGEDEESESSEDEDSDEDEESSEDSDEDEAVAEDEEPDLTPEPARPDEDPDRDYVPFALRNPGGNVGIGVQKVKKP